MMNHPICVTCGVQHDAQDDGRKICEDDRQYVAWAGQQWRTLDQMRGDGYRNRIEEIETDRWGIGTEPRFAIGQRTLLVRTGTGIVLWDPVSCLDDETVGTIGDLGGVQAISASHPHFYGAIVEWSHAFDGASIPLPEADRFWVWRTDAAYVCYQDLVSPVPGVSSFAVVDISRAALCCTGRRVPVERVRCSRETPSRSSWTGALPASCAHTRT